MDDDNDLSVEDAVERVGEEIDQHHYAGPDVPRADSVRFYMGLVEHCRSRVQLIRSEMNDPEEA